MTTIGYVGYPGEGKTYALVEYLLRERREGMRRPLPDGRPSVAVHANFRLGTWLPFCECRSPSRQHESACGELFVPFADVGLIREWDELMGLARERDRYGRPCGPRLVVGLDELNLWAPSRLWQALPVGLLSTWAYTRKNGMQVIWSSQSERRVDPVVREVTTRIVACRRIGPEARPVGFVRTLWLPGDVDAGSAVSKSRAARRLGWSFGRFKLSVARSFDTYERVPTSRHLEGRGARRERPAA